MANLLVFLADRLLRKTRRFAAASIAGVSLALTSGLPAAAQDAPDVAEFLDLAVVQAFDRQFSRFAAPEKPEKLRSTFWKNTWPAEDKTKFFDAVAAALLKEIRARDATAAELGGILLDLDAFGMDKVCADPGHACFTWRDIRNSTKADVEARIARGETMIVDARDQLIAKFIASAGPFLVAIEDAVLAELKALPEDDAHRVLRKILADAAIAEAQVLAVRALVKDLGDPDSESLRIAAGYMLGLAGVSASDVDAMKAAAAKVEEYYKLNVAELEGKVRLAGGRLKRELALQFKAEADRLIAPFRKIAALRSVENCGVDLSTYMPGPGTRCDALIRELSDPVEFAEKAKGLLDEKTREAKKKVETTAHEIEARFKDDAEAAFKELSPFEMVRRPSAENVATFDVYLIDYRQDASGGIRKPDPEPNWNSAGGAGIGYIDTGITMTYQVNKTDEGETLRYLDKTGGSLSVREPALYEFLQSYGLPDKLPFDVDHADLQIDELTKRLTSLKLKISIPVPFVDDNTKLEQVISLPPDQEDIRQTRASLEKQLRRVIDTQQMDAKEKISGKRIDFATGIWLDGFREGPDNSWAGGTLNYLADLNLQIPGSSCADTPLKVEIGLNSNDWSRASPVPAPANQSIIDCFSDLVRDRVNSFISGVATIAANEIPEGVYRLLVEATRFESRLRQPYLVYVSCISGGTGDDAILPACTTGPDGRLKGQKVTVRFDLRGGAPSVSFNPRLEDTLKTAAVERLKYYVRENVPDELDIFGIAARVEPNTASPGTYHLTMRNIPGAGGRQVRVSPVGISVSDNGTPAIDFQGARISCAETGQNWNDCVDVSMLGTGEFGPVRLKPVGFSGQALMIDLEFRNPFSGGDEYQSAGRITVDPVNKRIDASVLKPLILAQVRTRLKELMQSSGILGAHKLSNGVVIDVKMTAPDSADLKTLLTSYDIEINSIQLGPVALPATIRISGGQKPEVVIDERVLTGLFTSAISKQLSMAGIPCAIKNINKDKLADLAVRFGCKFDFGGVVQIGLDDIKLDARGLHMPEAVDVPVPGEIPVGTTGLVLTNLKVRVNFKRPDKVGMTGSVVPLSSGAKGVVSFESRLDLDISAQRLEAQGDLLLFSALNLATYNGQIDLKQRAFSWKGESAGQFDDIMSQKTEGSTNGETGITKYGSELNVLDIVDQKVDVSLTAKAELDAAIDFKFLGVTFDGAVKTREKLQAIEIGASGKLEVLGQELQSVKASADPYGAEVRFRVLGFGLEVTALSLGSVTRHQIEDAILSLLRFDKVFEALLKSLLNGEIKIALFQPVGVGDGSPMSADGNQGQANGTGGADGSRDGDSGGEPPGGADTVKAESQEEADKRRQSELSDPRALTTNYTSGDYKTCPSEPVTVAGKTAIRVWTVWHENPCPKEPPSWAPYRDLGYPADLANDDLGYKRLRYIGRVELPHDAWTAHVGRDAKPCRRAEVSALAFIDIEAGRLVVHTAGMKLDSGELAPIRKEIPFTQLLHGTGDWNKDLVEAFKNNIETKKWGLHGVHYGDRDQLQDDLARALSDTRSNCSFVTKGTLTAPAVDGLTPEDLEFYWQVRDLTGDGRLVSRSGRNIWVPEGTLLRALLDNNLIDRALTRDLIGFSYGQGWEVLHRDDDFKQVLIRVGGETNVRVYRDAAFDYGIEVDGLPEFDNGRDWKRDDPRILFLVSAARGGFHYVDFSREADGAYGAVHTGQKKLRINPVGHALLADAMDPEANIDVVVGSGGWDGQLKQARAICKTYGRGVLDGVDGLERLKKALFFFENPPVDRYCVNGRVLFKRMAE
ncbi:MAG: hypothetical protein KAH11_10010 [Rhodospirillales bacterium]|nr:hypothetical protein [Rhodospirillales bacterium]